MREGTLGRKHEMRPAGAARRESSGSVGELLQALPASTFGPSHAAYTSWKRHGHPTSEEAPSTHVFGTATRADGLSTKDLLYCSSEGSPPPPPQRLPQTTDVNILTWSNAPQEPPRRRPDLDEAAAEQESLRQAAAARSPAPTARRADRTEPDLDELARKYDDRKRGSPVSVSSCLVHMPISAERPPKSPPPLVSMHSIGLATAPHAGVDAYHPRSQSFSSTFVDPYD